MPFVPLHIVSAQSDCPKPQCGRNWQKSWAERLSIKQHFKSVALEQDIKAPGRLGGKGFIRNSIQPLTGNALLHQQTRPVQGHAQKGAGRGIAQVDVAIHVFLLRNGHGQRNIIPKVAAAQHDRVSPALLRGQHNIPPRGFHPGAKGHPAFGGVALCQ